MYPETVRLVYRHFPLTNIHEHALKSAEAAEAAGAQGAFWPYHDLLFERQQQWSGLSEADARQFFIDLAAELDLDVERFTAELDDGVYTDYVLALQQEAGNLGLPGTPSVIYNGRPLVGDNLPRALPIWDAFVQLELLREEQYDAAPPMTIDADATYRARVEMASDEEFVIELLPESAPETVNSFVFLAEEGWFDGVTFHRVLPGFVAQTGDPSGTGLGGPGYTIPNEIDSDLSHAEAGMVAMANSGPDTNGSQWYITLDDVSQLDGNYTIFGRVVSGLDVVQSLTPRDPAANPLAPPGDVIERVTIEVEP